MTFLNGVFSLSGDRFSLTYTRTQVPFQEVLDVLQLKFKDNKIKDFLILKKFHNEPMLKRNIYKPGHKSETSLHVYLILEKETVIDDPHFLNLSIGEYCHTGFFRLPFTEGEEESLRSLLYDVIFLDDSFIYYSPYFSDYITKMVLEIDWKIRMRDLSEIGEIKSALQILKDENSYQFLKNSRRVEKSLKYYHTLYKKLK